MKQSAYVVTAVVTVEFAVRRLLRTSLLGAYGYAAPWLPWLMLCVVTLLVGAVAMRAIADMRRRAGEQPGGAPARPAVDAVMRCVVALGLVFGLYAQGELGARLQSDGFYYFAYLRSLAFDHDVNFDNDYRMLGLGNNPHLFTPTPTGYAQSAWTIGPAIVWSPFFAVGHLAATTLHARGTDVTTDGTSYPYRQAVCIAGLLYGLLGWWFCYRFAAIWFRADRAALAVVTLALASFMVWYLVKEPSMTHAPSMASVAVFAYVWGRVFADAGRVDPDAPGARTARRWLALGFAVGVMANIRWQNALFALMPATELMMGLWGDRRAERVKASAVVVGAAAIGALVGFAPQMVAWKSIYGSFLAISPIGPQIRWFDSHIVDILFSARNGLFSTSPVIYAAAIGLFALAVRNVRLALPLIVPVVVMVYFNGAVQDWWGSASFGMRRFDGIMPMMTVGLVVFFDVVRTAVARRPGIVVAGAATMLAVWNLALVQVAQQGTARVGEGISFADAGAAQIRAVHGWIGYPFSWPVNLAYAVGNGVSPGAYDVLSAQRFLADPARPYGRLDIGLDDDVFIGTGWHAPERDRDVTFRWAGREAHVRLPIDHRADLKVELRLRPFRVPTQPDVAVTVRINGAAFGPYPTTDGWQTLEFLTPRDVWRSGLNAVVIESSSEQSPQAALGVGDARMLSLAIDFLRIRIQPE